jgi:hypothetical protein
LLCTDSAGYKIKETPFIETFMQQTAPRHTIDSFYQALGALAGLYAHAYKMKSGLPEGQLLEPPRDSVINCLSTVWMISEAARQMQFNQEQLDPLRYVAQVARRIEIVHKHINFWTATGHLFRLTFLAEAAWLRCIKRFHAIGAEEELVAKLRKESEMRRGKVRELYLIEHNRTVDVQKKYAEPVSLVS